MNKKGKNNGFVVVIAIIIAILLFKSIPLFSVFGSLEAQFEQEYNTYWGDNTDGVIDPNVCNQLSSQSAVDNYMTTTTTLPKCGYTNFQPYYYRYEDSKFTSNGRYIATSYVTSDYIQVKASFFESPVTLTTKKTFDGEDVAIIVGGGIMTSSGSSGSCSLSPGGSFKLGGDTGIIYKAHTFDDGY